MLPNFLELIQRVIQQFLNLLTKKNLALSNGFHELV